MVFAPFSILLGSHSRPPSPASRVTLAFLARSAGLGLNLPIDPDAELSQGALPRVPGGDAGFLGDGCAALRCRPRLPIL